MSYSEVSLHIYAAVVIRYTPRGALCLCASCTNPFSIITFLSMYKSVFSLVEAALKNLNDKTKDLNQFHVVNCINYGIFKII